MRIFRHLIVALIAFAIANAGVFAQQVGPSGSIASSNAANLAPGVILAAIGDSEIANGTANTNTGGQTGGYVGAGALTWARDFSGQAVQFPPANNFAVGGTTWAACAGQMTNALAVKPQYIYMGAGTNDAANGTIAVATSLSQAYACLRTAFAAGAQPILRLPTPRSDAGFSTAVMQWINSFNKTMQDLCNGRADLVTAAGLNANNLPICLDVSGYANYAATNGTSNPEMIGNDGLHMTSGGGVYEGWQIAQIINNRRPQPPQSFETSPYDIYDATNLINGSIAVFGSVNRGMMQGTGGSQLGQGSCTTSGSVATNWKMLCNTASTATMTGIKENPRLDGLVSGERQEIIISSAGSGNGQELYQFNLVNAVQGIRGSYSAGDQIVFQVKVQIKSCVGLEGIQGQIAESGPATPQTNGDNIIASNYVNGMNCAQYPQLLNSYVLRTPPMTLQSGNTDLFASILMGMHGSGGANSLDVLFSDARVFKAPCVREVAA